MSAGNRALIIKNMVEDINKEIKNRNTAANTIQGAIRARIARKKTLNIIETKAYNNARKKLMENMKKEADDLIRKNKIDKGFAKMNEFRKKKELAESERKDTPTPTAIAKSYAEVLGMVKRRRGRPSKKQSLTSVYNEIVKPTVAMSYADVLAKKKRGRPSKKQSLTNVYNEIVKKDEKVKKRGRPRKNKDLITSSPTVSMSYADVLAKKKRGRPSKKQSLTDVYIAMI